MKAVCRIRVSCLVGAVIATASMAMAQQEPARTDAPQLVAGTEAAARSSLSTISELETSRERRRFWDRSNAWLFAGVGASRTLDYFSTLNMRRRGRQEILLSNDAVDNHAAFAAIEAAGTAISIAASYVFHRYGHHKLERLTSTVHISLATTGAIRNYCLKTAHLAIAP